MKISQLITQLTSVMQEHGDIDVYVHNDMIADDPNPMFVSGGQWMAEGVYLN